jgi:two-component system OmpR family sensor kinase
MRSRPLSFRTRLTLRWTGAFGVLVTMAFLGVYWATRTYGYQFLDLHLRTIAATELAASTDRGAPVHLHAFPLEALNEGEFAPKFSRVYDGEGRTVLNTGEVRESEPLLDAATLRAALAGDAPVVDLRAHGRRARLVALRTTAQDGRVYVIAVGTFTEQLDAALARLGWILGGIWLLAISLTAAIGYVLASRALAPIDRISERAAAIARDQLDARLDPPAVDDEIGRMTDRLNEMLERLHKVIDANRHFAADASHELRTPLTAIRGEVDVALTRERTPEEYQATLGLIRSYVDDMFRLTEDLMLLIRAHQHDRAVVLDRVRVSSLLDGSRRRVAALAAERQVRVSVLTGPELVVFGDARLLGRALDNIVANAVQYSAPGSDVRMLARYVPAAGVRERADAAPEPADGTIAVEVSDHGPGIPSAEWERVFERFFRTDASRSRRTGGTGLGLAICRTILSLFGGSVRVLSSSEAGTTFEMRLRGSRGEQPGVELPAEHPAREVERTPVSPTIH